MLHRRRRRAYAQFSRSEISEGASAAKAPGSQHGALVTGSQSRVVEHDEDHSSCDEEPTIGDEVGGVMDEEERIWEDTHNIRIITAKKKRRKWSDVDFDLPKPARTTRI